MCLFPGSALVIMYEGQCLHNVISISDSLLIQRPSQEQKNTCCCYNQKGVIRTARPVMGGYFSSWGKVEFGIMLPTSQGIADQNMGSRHEPRVWRRRQVYCALNPYSRTFIMWIKTWSTLPLEVHILGDSHCCRCGAWVEPAHFALELRDRRMD